jgi:agmatine/peptidylarginine deiminase
MDMKYLAIVGFLLIAQTAIAQQEILPKGFTPEEKAALDRGDYTHQASTRGTTTPPPFDNLRTMAEWEEIQALTIAWTSYPRILKEIVAAAQNETQIIILSENPQETSNYLLSNQGGPALANLNNITIVDSNYDSIWMRDYAANTVYANDVEDLMLVDWIYNRPRPNDDASPQDVAETLNLPLFCTTEAPTDLVNTGGNFMSDGFGTAFASELILEENEFGNPYNVTPKSEQEIDAIFSDFMGINRFIKMENLPYDGIHHIDMHMKLLDEETLLVGEYPDNVSDGPQINANIEYVLSNFNSKWGTPYNVKRIPMPPSTSGLWPSSMPTPGFYRTYTNAVFVNKTIIIPTYRQEYDTTALRIWAEAMPGYNLVSIDSDNNDEPIIAASGAIHCITHSVGVSNPLLISHQPLRDTDNTTTAYSAIALIKHSSGIANASLFYKTSLTAEYIEIDMSSIGNDEFLGLIPPQPEGTTIYYYIQGVANSGKVLTRPIVAPDGYWQFTILGESTVGFEEITEQTFGQVFPNPASAITCVKLFLSTHQNGELEVINTLGQPVQQIAKGQFSPGNSTYFFDASTLAAGTYFLRFSSDKQVATEKIMVK